jgi:DNA-binding MarR family transcriptional regulator
MIRVARLSASASLLQVRQLTGYGRSALNKHRDFLVEARLIKEVPRKGDKRVVRFACTQRGRAKLEEIDQQIETEVMNSLCLPERSRLDTFALEVAKAFRTLPGQITFGSRAYTVDADLLLPNEHRYVRRTATNNESWTPD